RAAVTRRTHGELEVALVLLGGGTAYPGGTEYAGGGSGRVGGAAGPRREGVRACLGATEDGGVDVGRIGGVEVPDDEVDVPAQGERVLHAGVGGDDEARVGQPRCDSGVDRINARQRQSHGPP